MTTDRCRGAMRAFSLATALVLSSASVADAQGSGVRLALKPSAETPATFLIDRTETTYRGPVGGKTEPEKSELSSLVRVIGKASAKPGESTLMVTFLRVHGAVSGGRLPQPVTFDRNTKDAPDGRPETALVGKTVEIDIRPDGRVTAIRGIDADSTGSASVAIATVADLSTLVTILPDGPVGPADTWTGDQLEGRGLLRRRVTTTSRFDGSWDTDATIEVDGKIVPAPEGAPKEFAESIRLVKGLRRATYRLSLVDGLPTTARHVTEFTVEAPLSASGVEIRVATKTVVNVRRRLPTTPHQCPPT
jgi:hypothetical protein